MHLEALLPETQSPTYPVTLRGERQEKSQYSGMNVASNWWAWPGARLPGRQSQPCHPLTVHPCVSASSSEMWGTYLNPLPVPGLLWRWPDGIPAEGPASRLVHQDCTRNAGTCTCSKMGTHVHSLTNSAKWSLLYIFNHHTSFYFEISKKIKVSSNSHVLWSANKSSSQNKQGQHVEGCRHKPAGNVCG